MAANSLNASPARVVELADTGGLNPPLLRKVRVRSPPRAQEDQVNTGSTSDRSGGRGSTIPARALSRLRAVVASSSHDGDEQRCVVASVAVGDSILERRA